MVMVEQSDDFVNPLRNFLEQESPNIFFPNGKRIVGVEYVAASVV